CTGFRWSVSPDFPINDLEAFFSETTIKRPKNEGKWSIRLNQWSKITDVAKYIESHFATIKRNDGNKIFLPYLHRLQELKQYLKEKYNCYEI
ncbi:MAG: hypothetical protein WAU23_09220, partial [Ferruginibacter sp.]